MYMYYNFYTLFTCSLFYYFVSLINLISHENIAKSPKTNKSTPRNKSTTWDQFPKLNKRTTPNNSVPPCQISENYNN